MKYKLIVSDIDGTLICNKKEVSEKTKELVGRFKKMGGSFTIATGRMEAAIQPIISELNIDIPVIVYNGSAVVNTITNEIIYESKLDYDLARIALKTCKNHDLDAILYLDRKAYIDKMTPSIAKHVDKEKVGCIEVGDLYEFLKVAPTKILFIGKEKGFDPFISHLKRIIEVSLNFICSERNYLELLPADASKGRALQILADKLDISIEEIIAIGDERNDISMIEAAGLGVAVRNAKDELQKKANFITSYDCNEGVEEILQKVINDVEIK